MRGRHSGAMIRNRWARRGEVSQDPRDADDLAGSPLLALRNEFFNLSSVGSAVDLHTEDSVSAVYRGDQMASYVETSLTRDENILYRGKVSVPSLFGDIIVGLVLLPLYGLGLIFLLGAAIRYFTTEVAITNKRVVAKFGLIRRRTIEINLQKIESIQVNQGIFGRIFGFGSIIVAGAGNPQAPIPGIADPLSFRRAFIDIQEQTAAAA